LVIDHLSFGGWFQKIHPFAYKFFSVNGAWKVFENQLPSDYQNTVPRKQWAGPFGLMVPGVGHVYIFGKVAEYKRARKPFEQLMQQGERSGITKV
jgi:hypothetical protein